MTPLLDNRAITALFRVWGPIGRPLQGDAVRRLSGRGSHFGEVRVLGTVVPILVAAMVGERLVVWLNPWWAAVFAVPAFVVTLHVLGLAIGLLTKPFARMGAAAELWRWRGWALVLTGWSLWVVGDEGWARWVGGAWLLVIGLNALSWLLLGWRRLMGLPGQGGTAIRLVLALMLHLVLVPLVLVVGWWGLLWGAALAAAWAWVTFRPHSMGFGPVISRCDGDGVWLTIDDGPDPSTTPRLLDLLDAHHARATFFVIGERVSRCPELAREIVARGHELGNHSGSHPRASFWAAGPGRAKREIRAGSRAIEEATGVAPRWFRAPVGHCSYFCHPPATGAGMQVVAWSKRGFDGVSRNVEVVLRRLLRKVARGDILVIHDATPVAHEVLDGVLAGLHEHGLKCRLPDG